mmetsp:Transcript_4793/g.7642  ORF Transcript_4793/g.7642 Transcript_4793/m.7642 type:complete len:136 (-) Transcript_4793:37-444(-)
MYCQSVEESLDGIPVHITNSALATVTVPPNKTNSGKASNCNSGCGITATQIGASTAAYSNDSLEGMCDTSLIARTLPTEPASPFPIMTVKQAIEVYRMQLQQLESMGFPSYEQNAQFLVDCKGDVELVVARILGL